jgi:hypothetical protein
MNITFSLNKSRRFGIDIQVCSYQRVFPKMNEPQEKDRWDGMKQI